MDLITQNTTNEIICNISNEVEFDYFTLVVESDVYSDTLDVTPLTNVDNRYTEFNYLEGTDLTFPATGDYPYKIINTATINSTEGIEVHRGILRLKQEAEVVHSHTNNDTTIIYEP